MAKRAYTLIAEHFGSDAADIRECEYQHGRTTKPIYSLSDNEYWAAGKTAPVDPSGVLTNWERVISSYDRVSVLWVHRGTDADDEPEDAS